MKKKFNVNNASIGGGTMKNLLFILAVAALLGAQASPAAAHSALLNCFDNADGTFTCQGGYSDGSSATGDPEQATGGFFGIVRRWGRSFRRGTRRFSCALEGGLRPVIRLSGRQDVKDGRKDRAYREPLAAQSGHYGKECRARDALSHMRAGVFPEPGEQTIPVSV